jgi:hypothetical protein
MVIHRNIPTTYVLPLAGMIPTPGLCQPLFFTDWHHTAVLEGQYWHHTAVLEGHHMVSA